MTSYEFKTVGTAAGAAGVIEGKGKLCINFGQEKQTEKKETKPDTHCIDCSYMDVSKNHGTPKSSILIGFSQPGSSSENLWK